MAQPSNDSMPDSSNKPMYDSSNNTVSDSVANSNGLRVDSSALVGHLSHVSVNIVGVVVDVLDPSVGQVDGVVSLPGSGAIVRLLSVKAGSRVVVSHGILIGVGGDLVRVGLGVVGWSRLVSNWSRGVHRGSRGSGSQTGGDDEDLNN